MWVYIARRLYNRKTDCLHAVCKNVCNWTLSLQLLPRLSARLSARLMATLSLEAPVIIQDGKWKSTAISDVRSCVMLILPRAGCVLLEFSTGTRILYIQSLRPLSCTKDY